MKRPWACLSLILFAPVTHAEATFPEGQGKDALLKICGQCHSAKIMLGMTKSKQGWAAMIDDMVERGASGSDEEIEEITDYLNKNFGKSTAEKINVNTATAKDLGQKLGFSEKEGQAILRYREEHGSIKSWDDLKKVPDLDLSKLEAKKERITF